MTRHDEPEPPIAVTSESVRRWAVEVRFASRSDRPNLSAMRRELGHLQPVLFDASDAIGLRVEVRAHDKRQAIAYVETRIRARHWPGPRQLAYCIDVTSRDE